MIVNLDEMKGYLRVDFDDDDALIENFITTGQNLCADIARLSVDELGAIPSSKIAVMYAVAYLYEHREDADHHQLTISLHDCHLIKFTHFNAYTIISQALVRHIKKADIFSYNIKQCTPAYVHRNLLWLFF